MFDKVTRINPKIKKENMVIKNIFVVLSAPLNSFHTKIPHSIATTGAALLKAYVINILCSFTSKYQ